MRIFLLVGLVILGLNQGYCQAQEPVLEGPETWRSEIIPFPLSFAPEIDLVGYEDILFAPGWADSTSNEFWTYTFVWFVEAGEPLNEKTLISYFNTYYDGLMKVVAQKDVDQIGKTRSEFGRASEGFKGRVSLYDAFFTNRQMEVNLIVKELQCSESDKRLISFKVSPKEFDHDVWNLFKEIGVNVDCK